MKEQNELFPAYSFYICFERTGSFLFSFSASNSLPIRNTTYKWWTCSLPPHLISCGIWGFILNGVNVLWASKLYSILSETVCQTVDKRYIWHGLCAKYKNFFYLTAIASRWLSGNLLIWTAKPTLLLVQTEKQFGIMKVSGDYLRCRRWWWMPRLI